MSADSFILASAWFQSHFGLIWTFSKHGMPIYDLKISIPFWSDLNMAKKKTSKPERGISIPFWSDLNERNSLRVVEIRRNISIPFWSDLNPTELRKVWNAALDFNPILVWFERPEGLQHHRSRRKFQSHFGLIWTISNFSRFLDLKLFQAFFHLYTSANLQSCNFYIKPRDFLLFILFHLSLF